MKHRPLAEFLHYVKNSAPLKHLVNQELRSAQNVYIIGRTESGLCNHRTKTLLSVSHLEIKCHFSIAVYTCNLCFHKLFPPTPYSTDNAIARVNKTFI